MFKAVFALTLPLLALASPQIYGPPPPVVNTPSSTIAVAAAAPSAPADTPGHINV